METSSKSLKPKKKSLKIKKTRKQYLIDILSLYKMELLYKDFMDKFKLSKLETEQEKIGLKAFKYQDTPTNAETYEYESISKYLSNYFKQAISKNNYNLDFEINVARSKIEKLEKNVSTLTDGNDIFNIENNILFKLKPITDNLFDMINSLNILPKNITIDDFNKIKPETEELDNSKVSEFSNSILSNPKLNKDKTYTDDYIRNFKIYLTTLIELLYNHNVNVIFYTDLKDFNNNLRKQKPLREDDRLIYDKDKFSVSNKTLMFSIMFPKNLSFYSKNKSTREKDIIYEFIWCLNAENNLIQFNIPQKILDKINHSEIFEAKREGFLKVNEEPVRDKIKVNIENENFVKFNPIDKTIPLNVIEIKLPDKKNPSTSTITKTFLLGVDNNLYEDDDDKNNLVGKIISFKQDSTIIKDFSRGPTIADIKFCEDYVY